MKKRCFQKGFTLIEAMTAILVLTLGIIFVLQIFPLALGAERGSQLKSQAASLAQEKIEVIFNQNYDDALVGDVLEASLAAPFLDFSRQTKIRYVDQNLQEVASDQGIKKIEVIVLWKGGLVFTTRQVKIITLIAKK